MSSAAPEPRTRPPGADLRILVPLRPLGPIEVLDRATHVLRARAGDVLGVSAAVQLPIWLVLALVLRDGWASGVADNQAWFWLAIFPDPVTLGLLADEAADHGTLAVILARALPSWGLAVIGASCGVLARDWSLGIATTGTQALGQVARRLHLLTALWALVHVAELVTCIGVVVGPLVFGIAAPLWAIERTGPWTAFVRSWRLSLRRLGPFLVSIPVATLVAAMTAGIVGAIGLSILNGLAGGWIDTGGAAVTALAAALPHLVLDPLLAMSMALLALDAKVQVEGYDIEVELDEADAEAEARARRTLGG